MNAVDDGFKQPSQPARRREAEVGDAPGGQRKVEWHCLQVAFISMRAELDAAASLAEAAAPRALAFALSCTASASNPGPLEKSLILRLVASIRRAASANAA